MMELYGPLYRHQNEGQERFNDRLTGRRRKKRHSQNGGACNRGAARRRALRVARCDGRQVRLDRDVGRPLVVHGGLQSTKDP